MRKRVFLFQIPLHILSRNTLNNNVCRLAAQVLRLNTAADIDIVRLAAIARVNPHSRAKVIPDIIKDREQDTIHRI